MAGVFLVLPLFVHKVCYSKYICSLSPELLISFMEFGHNIKFQNVFLKFDNGPYQDMHSRVIALCENIDIFYVSKSSNFDHNFMKLAHTV